MAAGLDRRKFLALAGVAATWPALVSAQQPTMPVVGFLASASEAAYTSTASSVRAGLNESGFAENRNVLIDYR